MILKYLRQQMLLPQEEYIINKHANIRGVDVLLLSFTIEEDKNRLWLMYENKDSIGNSFDNEYMESKTNREEMIHNIDEYNRRKDFYIKEMEIQGQIIRFDSCSSSSVYDMNREGIMQLQHFAEKGLISSEWDDVRLEDLVITEYEQVKGEVTPNIDETKELSILLHIEKSLKEVPIQCPFKIEFGKQDIGTKVVYYDEMLKMEKYFFINEVYSYNAFEDVAKRADEIEDIKIREDMLNNFIEAMENLCPRDKNLAIIKYETVDNIQLNFMMKDYLESEPIKKSASAIGFICGSNEIGANGYKLRECVMHPVDKDFSGEIELELFSRIIEIPEETVKCF